MGFLSRLDPLLPGLWSAVAFLAPGCDGGLLESFFFLDDDDGGEAEVAEAGRMAQKSFKVMTVRGPFNLPLKCLLEGPYLMIEAGIKNF